jgi:hypothetical protein
MIPKRALFYWDHKSPQISWLRMQSMVTFARLNPDWEIVTLDGQDAPEILQKDDEIYPVLRSDYCRYKALAEGGGMYFDTDIIFTKPFPEAWLNGDLALPLWPNNQLCGVAMLGAAPNSPFFSSVVRKCNVRLGEPLLLAYQSLGIKIMLHIEPFSTAAAMNLSLVIIPADSHLAVMWGDVERLWSPLKKYLPAVAIGLHWYGGDRLSLEYEKRFDDPEFRRSIQCPVADALGELIESAA